MARTYGVVADTTVDVAHLGQLTVAVRNVDVRAIQNSDLSKREKYTTRLALDWQKKTSLPSLNQMSSWITSDFKPTIVPHRCPANACIKERKRLSPNFLKGADNLFSLSTTWNKSGHSARFQSKSGRVEDI